MEIIEIFYEIMWGIAREAVRFRQVEGIAFGMEYFGIKMIPVSLFFGLFFIHRNNFVLNKVFKYRALCLGLFYALNCLIILLITDRRPI